MDSKLETPNQCLRVLGWNLLVYTPEIQNTRVKPQHPQRWLRPARTSQIRAPFFSLESCWLLKLLLFLLQLTATHIRQSKKWEPMICGLLIFECMSLQQEFSESMHVPASLVLCVSGRKTTTIILGDFDAPQVPAVRLWIWHPSQLLSTLSNAHFKSEPPGNTLLPTPLQVGTQKCSHR